MAVKLNYLCSNHRAYLLSEPSRAMAFWQQGFDTAQDFCEDCSWLDALPHVGSAFETAEIILTAKVEESKNAFNLMISSTELLAFTLINLGEFHQAKDVYLMTIERLEKEIYHGITQYSELQQNLSFLYKSIENIFLTFDVTACGSASAAVCSSEFLH